MKRQPTKSTSTTPQSSSTQNAQNVQNGQDSNILPKAFLALSILCALYIGYKALDREDIGTFLRCILTLTSSPSARCLDVIGDSSVVIAAALFPIGLLAAASLSLKPSDNNPPTSNAASSNSPSLTNN